MLLPLVLFEALLEESPWVNYHDHGDQGRSKMNWWREFIKLKENYHP